LRDYAAYSNGWAYQKKGNFPAAMEWYHRLIREFPQSELRATAGIRIGECHYTIKEYHKAIEELQKAKGLTTDNGERGEADYLIAESYYNLQEYETARKQYAEFLRTYTDHRLRRDVEYALGWTYLKEKDYGKAIDSFFRLTEKSDYIGHAALYRVGVTLQLAGKVDSARSIFQEVQKRSPTGEFADNALFDAGMILFDQKRLSDAKELFRQLVSDYSTSDVLADGFRMYGECLLAEPQLEEARKAFEKALISPNPSFDTRVASAFKIAWIYYKQKSFQQAAAAFTDFTRDYPEHPYATEAWFWLAEAEYQLSRFASARTNYEKVAGLPRHEKKEEALYGAAWSLYKMNEFGRAITAFERLLNAFPNGQFAFEARLRIADCAFFLKEYRQAASSYRTLLRTHPKHEMLDYVNYQLGLTLYRAGDQEQAMGQFRSVIKGFPKSSYADDAQYTLGWIWFQSKEYREAIREFEKVVSDYPASELVPRAYYSIGDSYYNLKQYAQAERAYRNVLQKSPESSFVVDAISGIQFCLVAQGRSQDALKVIDDYVKQNPGSTAAQNLYLRKGDLLLGQKEYVKAAKEYQSFIDRYPTSVLVPTALYSIGKALQAQADRRSVEYFQRAAESDKAPEKVVTQSLYEAGNEYFQRNQYDLALKAFQRIENEYPSSDLRPDASFMKGAIFFENGDMEEARNQFQFVAERFPSTLAGAKANLALVQLLLGDRRFSDARQRAQGVATTRTDELGAEAQYLIGISYGEQGNWDEAVKAFLRVRYVFPAQQTWVVKSYLALGNAYEQLKDYRRAKEAYESVLKLEREGEAMTEAQKRLRQLERM
jgi:TolA-binding protein